MTQIIGEVDVEFVVRDWLETYTGVTSMTETDNTLFVPLYRVRRLGGADDGVTLDRATLSIHAFAATREAARALAYQGRTALYAGRGVPHLGAVITKVATIGGPAWVPYDNTNVRDFAGTYQVSVKHA